MKSKNYYCLLLIFACNSLLLNQLSGQIDYSGLNPNFPISYEASSETKGKPGIAFDGSNFICVWQKGTSIYDIYATRISPTGLILDTIGIPICVGLNESSYYPSVAFDGTNYLVVWIAQRNGVSEIYGSRVTPGGIVLDAGGVKLTTGADPLMRMPAISFGGGNYFIVWRTNSSDIYGARISTSLTNLDAPRGFVISNTHTSYYPAVAFDGINYMVSWHDSRNSSTGWDIYASRVTKGGVVLDPNGFVVCNEPQNQEHTTIAFDGSNYIIVWYDWRPNSNQIIGSLYATRVSPNGTVLDIPAIFISDHVRGQWAPQVASSGGESMVVWNMELHGNANARLWDIYGTRISKDGKILDRGINISTSFWHQAQPIIGYGGGKYLITWNDMRNNDGVNGMYGQLIGKDETGFSTPFKEGISLSGNWSNQTYNFSSGATDGIALSDSNVYLFGSGEIIHNNGNNWHYEKSSGSFYSSCALDSSTFFAGGWYGSYYMYNINTGRENNEHIESTPLITGVYGYKNNIWMATIKGGLYKISDANIFGKRETILENGPVDFEDIWGIDSTHIYIVGEKGLILNYNGTEWRKSFNIPIKQTLNSIWGVANDNIFVVGDWGTILHFNGTSWTLQESPTEESLFDIWGIDGNNIYAVGNNGTIIHYDGREWKLIGVDTKQDLFTVFGYYNKAGNKYTVWAAGAGNIILQYNAIINNKKTTICEGDSILIGGHYQTKPGKYYDFKYSLAGVDSVISTTLYFLPAITYISKTICPGDSIVIGNSIIKIPGIHTIKLSNQLGCDSTIIINLTIEDKVLPTIACPANVNTNTNTDCTASGVNLGIPITSDNCGVAAVINNAPAAFPIGSTTVTWTVRDKSGNLATCNQVVTVKDTILPKISCPSNVNANTNSDCTATGVNLGVPITSDNCGIAWVTNNAPVIFPIGSTTITWTVADNSGNNASCTQAIIVSDKTPPTITRPGDILVQCESDIPQPNPSAIIASDNCGNVIITFVSDISDGKSCPETIARIYRATDNSSNFSECIQKITVNDKESPALNCPPATTIERLDNLKPAYNTLEGLVRDGGSITDNCIIDPSSFELVAQLIDTTSIPAMVKRTYYIKDKCGNANICLQKISVLKTTNVSTIGESNDFKYTIIPNPNRGIFNFRIDSDLGNDLTLKLLNTVGQVVEVRTVKPASINQTELFDVSYLSKGIYHLVITSDKFQKSEKIVVQ